MATTIRGGGFGKEKRGTSPSNPVVKRSPKPVSSSSSPNYEKTTSPTDGKPVPNYLRPTISSSLDSSRTPKKSEPDSSSSKPVLNRRRSFDRPPPASQVHKAIRNVPGLHKPFRSSSFSSKPLSHPTSSGSTKLGPSSSSERPSVKKDSKVVEQPRLVKSRSLKKTALSSSSPSSSSKNKESDHHRSTLSTTEKKKGPRSMTSESSEYESRSSIDHLVIDDDDMVNIDHEVESLPEISEMPESNKDLGDPIQLENTKQKAEAEVEKLEATVEVEEEKAAASDQASEEPAPQESAYPELVIQQEDQIVETKEPEVQDNVEVEGAEEQNETGEDAGVDQEMLPKADNTEVMAEEVEVEEEKEEELVETEPEVAEGDKTEAKDETESVAVPSEETSSSSASVSAVAAPVKATAQSAAGKKENQAYNDVIEQTATKLMGKKNKNKVLALAGAFETVISLQDNNSNSSNNKN